MTSPKKIYNDATFLNKVPTHLIPAEKRFIANDENLNHIYVFHVDELYEHFRNAGLWLNPYTSRKFNERDQLALRENEKIQQLFLAQKEQEKAVLHDLVIHLFPEKSVTISMDNTNDMFYLNFANSALFAAADKGFIDYTKLKYFENKNNCFQLFLSEKLIKILLDDTEYQKLKDKIAHLYTAEEKSRIRDLIMHYDSKYPEAMLHFKEIVNEMVLRILKNSCNEELFLIAQEFDDLRNKIEKFYDEPSVPHDMN
jgi:hypothetical protein